MAFYYDYTRVYLSNKLRAIFFKIAETTSDVSITLTLNAGSLVGPREEGLAGTPAPVAYRAEDIFLALPIAVALVPQDVAARRCCQRTHLKRRTAMK